VNRFAFLAMGLIVAVPAAAHDEAAQPQNNRQYRFEVTPFAGYRVGGTFEDETTGAELDLDDNGSFGLILNMQEAANTEWELGYSHQSTEVDVGDSGETIDMDVDYLQIGGTYLGDGELARPFLVATVGLAHLDPRASEFSSDTFFAFSIGGGWKMRPARRLGLRVEGRFYGTVIDSDSDIFCTSGPEGSNCLIRTKGEVLWQWEMMLGAIFRF